MPASYTDVIAAHRKTLDSLAALAFTTIEVSERLLSLNLQTTRRFVNDAVARNQALRGTGDLHEALAVYAAFSQPWLDRVLTYSRRYHDILAETHTQLVRASEACTADFQQSMATLLERTAASSPVGSKATSALVQSARNAVSSAVEEFQRAAQPVLEISEAGAAALACTTARVVDAATASATLATERKPKRRSS